MITLLSKLFIKDRKNYESAAVRGQYGLLCGVWGIVLNLLLFAAKMIAGMLANSVSVLADAFNNLSDAGSSLVRRRRKKLTATIPSVTEDMNISQDL